MSCPICGKPTVPAYRPFCSGRCADVDLGRWLTGGYTIPIEEEEPVDPDEDAGAPDRKSRTGLWTSPRSHG